MRRSSGRCVFKKYKNYTTNQKAEQAISWQRKKGLIPASQISATADLNESKEASAAQVGGGVVALKAHHIPMRAGARARVFVARQLTVDRLHHALRLHRFVVQLH